jgi:ATP-dependent protease ClpP protease subunit
MHDTTGRTVALWGMEITPENTFHIRAELEELLAEDRDAWITLEIFSPGGEWISGRALYDWIMLNVPNLQTVSYGWVASMAVALYLAGKHRVVTAGSEFILHPAKDFMDGPAVYEITDYKDAASSLKKMQATYNNLLLNRMDKPPSKEEFEAAMSRVSIVSPRKALKWGLAHELWKP